MSILDDMYELNLAHDNKISPKFVVPAGHEILTMNWLDEHNKTNLDSTITPLTQAAYLGRRKVIELLLQYFP